MQKIIQRVAFAALLAAGLALAALALQPGVSEARNNPFDCIPDTFYESLHGVSMCDGGGSGGGDGGSDGGGGSGGSGGGTGGGTTPPTSPSPTFPGPSWVCFDIVGAEMYEVSCDPPDDLGPDD
jgi:hypothetical protein